ncbi:type II secretion system F family protein [Nocardioides zeae]|uniref:Type II secretion system F family protein n=1 Tax=Nocardioides imazamoxiresistens TaxID=3231893 RepID=A0ABU3PQT1_9ACTN|nr:type II secretion system F family protein [Nocardioides zeae]MDT9591577.1 type II secretion system F family protein [Nocardioides zeae]
MTPELWGALLGATAGMGLLLVVARVRAVRRPSLELRVLPFVRDVQRGTGAAPRRVVVDAPRAPGIAGVPLAVFGPVVRRVANGLETVLGGATSVRRRLERAGLERSVHDFRVEQVVWGVVGFGVAAAWGTLRTLGDPGAALGSFVGCLLAFAVGVLLRDQHLTSQVRRRERRILSEFPTVAELLALAVAAGEGPVPAMERVVARSRGELSRDLRGVLGAVRTGVPVAEAFDRLAATTGLPLVARFASGIAVAVERGTPLADVLHAQAADVRDAGRRELIEGAARREVFMMVPVVFLVLPVTVLFAFYPGVIGLRLVAP